MTLYSVVVFLHVLGTLMLFAALVLEGVSLWHLRGAVVAEHVRIWSSVGVRVVFVSTVAMPLLFLSGAYLAREGRLWNQGWLQIGLAATFVIAVMTGGITRPRIKVIRRAAAEARDVSGVLRTRLRDPFLRVSFQLRSALSLGAMFLMITKTSFGTALLVMAVAVAGGVAASAIHRSRRDVAALTS